MRTKTLFSLIVLCGSTAALAHMAPAQTGDPSSLQNNMVNEGVPAPEETTAPEGWSNSTDPQPMPTDPTDNGTETMPEPEMGPDMAPNSTAY